MAILRFPTLIPKKARELGFADVEYYEYELSGYLLHHPEELLLGLTIRLHQKNLLFLHLKDTDPFPEKVIFVGEEIVPYIITPIYVKDYVFYRAEII
jgi:hypothetical protein